MLAAADDASEDPTVFVVDHDDSQPRSGDRGRVTASWGHGAALSLVVLVAFAAASESRQWIHLLPLFVAATVAATDDEWTPRRALVFTALALAWSKVWLHIGYDKAGDWRVFPTQRYFMNLGPWASDTSWAIHLAAAVVTAGVLWWVLRRPVHPPGYMPCHFPYAQVTE